MNAKEVKVPTDFGDETRFEVRPVAAIPFRDVLENRFEWLRNRLLRDRLDELWDPEFSAGLRRAANEAGELAWKTAFPLLVFPVLFEEKALAVRIGAVAGAPGTRKEHKLVAA